MLIHQSSTNLKSQKLGSVLNPFEQPRKSSEAPKFVFKEAQEKQVKEDDATKSKPLTTDTSLNVSRGSTLARALVMQLLKKSGINIADTIKTDEDEVLSDKEEDKLVEEDEELKKKHRSLTNVVAKENRDLSRGIEKYNELSKPDSSKTDLIKKTNAYEMLNRAAKELRVIDYNLTHCI